MFLIGQLWCDITFANHVIGGALLRTWNTTPFYAPAGDSPHFLTPTQHFTVPHLCCRQQSLPALHQRVAVVTWASSSKQRSNSQSRLLQRWHPGHLSHPSPSSGHHPGLIFPTDGPLLQAFLGSPLEAACAECLWP